LVANESIERRASEERLMGAVGEVKTSINDYMKGHAEVHKDLDSLGTDNSRIGAAREQGAAEATKSLIEKTDANRRWIISLTFTTGLAVVGLAVHLAETWHP
jgi:hypothetical protein